ncbi:MAG: 2-aminoethylphosphonate-pyruvate transaminase [Cocleimonas sp.]|jgi:2-aminoethylphosphonate-pyruvate transaminase
MKKYLLLTPGPVNIVSNVRAAIGNADICHREPDFESLLRGIEKKLLRLFELKTPKGMKKDYRAVVISGSGTAANESMLSSVVGDKNILVISNGEFGERLYATSNIHNSNTYLLEFPWGEELDFERIERYLLNQKIDVIAMVHHETSSGRLNPLRKIGALAKAHGAIFIVDCVSSAGAEDIDVKKSNIAFFSSSSSKAIGSYPGLSFVIGKDVEFKRLKHLPAKTSYLNLYTFYRFLKSSMQTPNTPAVPLFFAFNKALKNILDEGVEKRYTSLRDKAGVLRKGLRDMGFTFLLNEKDMCSILTTVIVPAHIDVGVLRKLLRDESIIIYEGKGCFKNKVFQVGNIGEISMSEIQRYLSVQKSILGKLHPIMEENKDGILELDLSIAELLPTIVDPALTSQLIQ